MTVSRTSVKCRAKDPNVCRFHAPDASQKAFLELQKVKQALAKATTIAELGQLTDKTEELQAIYDATDEGYQELRKLRRELSQADKWVDLHACNKRITKANIARQGEQQTGAATDVKFFFKADMENLKNSLLTTVKQGEWDGFLDIWDSYSSKMGEAIFQENSQEFVRTNNAIISELLDASEGVGWFDQDKKTAFEESLKAKLITGKIYNSAIEVNDISKSSIFEA